MKDMLASLPQLREVKEKVRSAFTQNELRSPSLTIAHGLYFSLHSCRYI